MRFLLPMVSAFLLAGSNQALAEGENAAKPLAGSVPAKVKVNKPASFFLEEIPAKAKATTKKAGTDGKAASGGKKVAEATPAKAGELLKKLEGQASLSKHFQQGLVMQSMGMTAHAIKEYQDALKEDPKFVSTYNNLAQCLVSRNEDGDKAEALRLLKEAKKLDPNNLGTLYSLAVLKEDDKDFKGAGEDYQKILAVQPFNMRAIQNLSEMYYRQGKKEEAKKVIQDAIKQNPPDQQLSVLKEALQNLDKKPIEASKP